MHREGEHGSVEAEGPQRFREEDKWRDMKSLRRKSRVEWVQQQSMAVMQVQAGSRTIALRESGDRATQERFAGDSSAVASLICVSSAKLLSSEIIFVISLRCAQRTCQRKLGNIVLIQRADVLIVCLFRL